MATVLKAIKAAVKSGVAVAGPWMASLLEVTLNPEVGVCRLHTQTEGEEEGWLVLSADKSLPMGSITDPSLVTQAWYATHVCIHLQVKWLTSHSAQTGVADRISPGLETTLIDKNKMNTYKTWMFMNSYKERRLKCRMGNLEFWRWPHWCLAFNYTRYDLWQNYLAWRDPRKPWDFTTA